MGEIISKYLALLISQCKVIIYGTNLCETGHGTHWMLEFQKFPETMFSLSVNVLDKKGNI